MMTPAAVFTGRNGDDGPRVLTDGSGDDGPRVFTGGSGDDDPSCSVYMRDGTPARPAVWVQQ